MTGLRLLAEDAEDLSVLSAHLQDAVIRVGDVVYLPKHRRFAALVSRYCWDEDCGKGNSGARCARRPALRRCAARAIAKRASGRSRRGGVALLAINFTPGGGGGGLVDLILAGGGRIRLHVECIDGTLRDLSEPRPAVARPAHDLGAG
jgi:hypothetical protein